MKLKFDFSRKGAKVAKKFLIMRPNHQAEWIDSGNGLIYFAAFAGFARNLFFELT
jgi:hypothetical protein